MWKTLQMCIYLYNICRIKKIMLLVGWVITHIQFWISSGLLIVWKKVKYVWHVATGNHLCLKCLLKGLHLSATEIILCIVQNHINQVPSITLEMLRQMLKITVNEDRLLIHGIVEYYFFYAIAKLICNIFIRNSTFKLHLNFSVVC